MVDTGWAGTFPKLLHLLKEKDIDVGDIEYLVITHFHPDHAGLVEDIKDHGARLIVHHAQVSAMGTLKKFFKPEHNFREIEAKNNITVSTPESRTLLKKAGIDGEIIPTPGHSEDSISLIVDECCAFTGDLPNLSLAAAYGDPELMDSWETIQSYRVKTIYPGHGNPFSL